MSGEKPSLFTELAMEDLSIDELVGHIADGLLDNTCCRTALTELAERLRALERERDRMLLRDCGTEDDVCIKPGTGLCHSCDYSAKMQEKVEGLEAENDQLRMGGVVQAVKCLACWWGDQLRDGRDGYGHYAHDGSFIGLCEVDDNTRLRERVAELERENRRLHNAHDELFPGCRNVVDALYAENAQLRADSERLEWLADITNLGHVIAFVRDWGFEVWSIEHLDTGPSDDRIGHAHKLREAIDAARHREQQAQGGGEE